MQEENKEVTVKCIAHNSVGYVETEKTTSLFFNFGPEVSPFNNEDKDFKTIWVYISRNSLLPALTQSIRKKLQSSVVSPQDRGIQFQSVGQWTDKIIPLKLGRQ